MMKGKYEEIVMCPFNECHRDLTCVGMGSYCLSCFYSMRHNGKMSEVIVLNENSDEVKKFKATQKGASLF